MLFVCVFVVDLRRRDVQMLVSRAGTRNGQPASYASRLLYYDVRRWTNDVDATAGAMRRTRRDVAVGVRAWRSVGIRRGQYLVRVVQGG